MPERGEGHPKVAPELDADQGSSSLEVYVREMFPREGWLFCSTCRRWWQERWFGPACACGRPGVPEELHEVPPLEPGVWEEVLFPDLAPVDAYEVLWPDKAKRQHAKPPRVVSTGTHDRAAAGRRVAGLLRHLNAATEGTRNATLHWVSCRVGEMLATGELTDVGDAMDALTQVALATGLHPSEVYGTTRSGFRASGVDW